MAMRQLFSTVVLGAMALASPQVRAQDPKAGCVSDKTLVRVGSIKGANPDKKRILRVWADPNNLPFTNSKLEGFENKIAEIIARELDADIEYTWHAQRRGFFRKALKEGNADLVLGAPVGFEMALTTAPYYRSTYVFVTRKDRGLNFESLDDPVLKKLKIGVQLIGDDGCNPPAAHALALRGIIDNVVGFTVYGDYADESPPARIVAAVAKGEIDTAIVWGPLAGYFAKHQPVAMELTPVTPAFDPPLRFTFGISLAVRRGDEEFREQLNEVLERRREDIARVLNNYGVPRVTEKKEAPRK